MSGYLESILVALCINVLLAYAAFLPLAAGQANLGIAGFMAIGAYASAYLSSLLQWPLLPAIAVGALIAGFFAWVIAYPILRARSVYLALATLALGECVRSLLMNFELMGGAAGFPVTSYLGWLPVLLTTVAVCALVYYLYHTRFGLCIMAVEDDEKVADLLGVRVRLVRVAAFTLGGLLAGIAGGLHGHHYSFIEAQHFTVLMSVFVVLYVLLGGSGSVFGPLVGAAFFTLMPELLRAGKEWRYVWFALFVVVVMAFRPKGLLSGEARARASKPGGTGAGVAEDAQALAGADR